MDNYVIELIKYRLKKAFDELELAEYCINDRKYSKSLNCSYYAIFHSARALLAIEKLDFKKHSGVIAYFIKKYINTNILDNELGEIIRSAERERNKSDYQDFYTISKDEALEQVIKAKLFFTKVDEYIKNIIVMESAKERE